MAGKQINIRDLSFTPIDARSPVPLYHQIEADLRNMILSGALSPGDILPPEMELCTIYGVGRHTMRTALARLTMDNLIERKAGRGTVVKQPSNHTKFYLDRSFTRQMEEMGMRSHSRVLDRSTGVINNTHPLPLQGKLGAPCFNLVRLRFGDDEPIGVQSTLVITEQCPGLEKYDFNIHSLYDVLARDYQLVINEISHTVSAVSADQMQAELLQVIEDEPLLMVNTSAYVNRREIIEYTSSYYRADKYEFSTTHTFSA